MHLLLENDEVSLNLTSDKDIDFKTLAAAYSLVTGDELEITENEPETQRGREKPYRFAEPEKLGWRLLFTG